jgi:dimethylhistidine N-methyltransferase
LRADVVRGLSAAEKAIPSKYFYDQAGSQLFEQICGLDEYYLTRTELAIMRRHSREMAALAGPDCLVIELGSGSSTKTQILLDQLQHPAAYVPVDLAEDLLRQSVRKLRRLYRRLDVLPICGDFTQAIDLPLARKQPARHLVYFPGSTLGNFQPAEARNLLRGTARLCGPGGALLIGVDLKKDPQLLHAAYNDSQGVTAAFNLNLLARLHRELGADCRLERFWHQAFYNPRLGRIEMHLVSRCRQQLHIDGSSFTLSEGESICTEFSYKYAPGDLECLSADAGFTLQQIWMDERRFFAVAYLQVKAA